MKVICFDLDDTLYKEIDYLKSAYREIACFAARHLNGCADSVNTMASRAYEWMMNAYRNGGNSFEALNHFLGLDIPVVDYLSIYRKHKPNISLSEEVVHVLSVLKEQGIILGLITDGRSIQQKHKIEALGLSAYFDDDNLVISEEFGSEKPSLPNYSYFIDKYPSCHDFTYVGDNLKKDFIAPNYLGWRTVCLMDDGRNIHKQEWEKLDKTSSPLIKIDSLLELLDLPSMDKKKSTIDELFYQLYGYCPKKAGTSLEILSGIAYSIINKDVVVKHDQKIKSDFCDTAYQLDGLVARPDGANEMIEAKDYTARNERVGRGDLQKMQGALTDLDVQRGKFVSATDYTKDAKEYAKGTQRNRRQVPIDLFQIYPSTKEDEKGRVKEIVVSMNVRCLDFASSQIIPIFDEKGLEFLKSHGFSNRHLALRIDGIYDKNGKVMQSIKEFTQGLNKLVDIKDSNQKEIIGETKMDGAYIKMVNDMLCPIAGLSYKVAIDDFNYEYSITQEGKPILLIRNLDGSTNKLLTDEELKKYQVMKDGTVVKIS